MKVNMGSQGSPESVSHWTAKSLLAHRLRRGMQNAGRLYGSPFRRQLRNIVFPESAEVPVGLEVAVQRVEERVDPISPLALAVLHEPAHSGCTGGGLIVNLLEGMRGGVVELEKAFGNYVPDVGLYREGESDPLIVIEVVNTNEPAESKLEFYKSSGVMAFQVSVDDKSDIMYVVGKTDVSVKGLSNVPCGEKVRREVSRNEEYMFDKDRSGESSFIGMKCHPSGSQQYVVGTWDPLEAESWHFGEPEIFGWCPTEVRWDSPPRVRPYGERSISKQAFLMHLVKAIHLAAYFMHDPHTTGQEKSGWYTLGLYAQDLLSCVHVAE